MSTIKGQPLCLSEGHDWISTQAHSYRRCQRSHCKAAQLLCGDTWVDVIQQSRTSKPRAKNLLLWDEPTMLSHGIHPQQKEIEDQAEHRWYDFVATEKRSRRGR